MTAELDTVYFEKHYGDYPTKKLVELLLERDLTQEALQGIKNILIKEAGDFTRAIQKCDYSVNSLIEILSTNSFDGISEVQEGMINALKVREIDFREAIEKEYKVSGNINLELDKVHALQGSENYTGTIFVTSKNLFFIPNSVENISSPGEAAALGSGVLGYAIYSLFADRKKPATQKREIFHLPLTLQAKYIKGSKEISISNISEVNIASSVAIKVKGEGQYSWGFSPHKKDKEKLKEALVKIGIKVVTKGFFRTLIGT